ncbi:glycosyltransferase family 9 protein [Cerasicoccus fimbriatus]|uniref:glycosyltransferase family 9 protein n=1 Tax=Cerasicoccus fimbriatus TaxID=3014554 RepID=UPI0022B2E71F|nr:glycosyltransferase family 9 protein [Cerasicoccus sp. TK19100]
MRREKILAIKFKFLGDVALMVPALRMLRQHQPEAEIHALVAAEAAPLLQRLSWIDKVWVLKRTRGKLRLRDSLPLIRELRAEQFDRSVDFVGNDRGAVLSRMIGARERLGVMAPKGFAGRAKCYTQTIEELDTTRHEIVRDAYVLSAWSVPFLRDGLSLELTPDPSLADEAKKILPNPGIIGHLSTSQPKKEWPVEHWVELHALMQKSGLPMVFTAGHTEREQALLTALKAALPEAHCLPAFASLELYIATIARASLFISPDTAPLHLAAALGVPTVGFFGPTASSRWAPLGPQNLSIQGAPCPCSGHLHVCDQPIPCINTVLPTDVAEAAFALLKGGSQ